MAEAGLAARRARDEVLNSAALIDDVATAAARALNLQGNNRTLGESLLSALCMGFRGGEGPVAKDLAILVCAGSGLMCSRVRCVVGVVV